MLINFGFYETSNSLIFEVQTIVKLVCSHISNSFSWRENRKTLTCDLSMFFSSSSSFSPCAQTLLNRPRVQAIDSVIFFSMLHFDGLERCLWLTLLHISLLLFSIVYLCVAWRFKVVDRFGNDQITYINIVVV